MNLRCSNCKKPVVKNGERYVHLFSGHSRCKPPLPGRLHYVLDQYGRIWNDEPILSWTQVSWFRKECREAFPEFQFSVTFDQRDPERPSPMYYHRFSFDPVEPWDEEKVETAKVEVIPELYADSDF